MGKGLGPEVALGRTRQQADPRSVSGSAHIATMAGCGQGRKGADPCSTGPPSRKTPNAPQRVRNDYGTDRQIQRFTMSVEACLAGVPTPFDAVIVMGYLPIVDGVPDRLAFPFPLSVNVTPIGSVPDSAIVGIG